MAADGRGLDMTGSAEAVAAYDQAIDHLVRFQPEVVDVVAEAAAADPGCLMARVFRAYRLGSTGSRLRPGAHGTSWPSVRYPVTSWCGILT